MYARISCDIKQAHMNLCMKHVHVTCTGYKLPFQKRVLGLTCFCSVPRGNRIATRMQLIPLQDKKKKVPH